MSSDSVISTGLLPFHYPPAHAPSFGTKIFLFLLSLVLMVSSFDFSNAVLHLLLEKQVVSNKSVLFLPRISSKQYVDILLNMDTTWTFVLLNSFMNGVCEEFIFRFLLFKTLLIDLCKLPFMAALTISACAFGAAHMNNMRMIGVRASTTQAVAAVMIGFLLGYLYYYTNDLFYVILLHGTYDFLVTVNSLVMFRHIMLSN